MVKLAGAQVALVIAHQEFRDEEYQHPRRALEDEGAKVVVASSQLGTAHGKLGMTVEPDLAIEDIRAGDFDAIVFVGGGGAAEYFESSEALQLAREGAAKGKVLGAICIAPGILARAGVLQGKRATTFPTEVDSLEAGGATYTRRSVERDGSIITANGPEAASEFGEILVQALAERRIALR